MCQTKDGHVYFFTSSFANFCRFDDFEKFFMYIFWRPVSVGHSFNLLVTHFVFLRDVWIRTQRAAVANRSATNFATHLFTNLATHLNL